jgi:ubiquitin carboxyl-terminal hydrolase L5
VVIYSIIATGPCTEDNWAQKANQVIMERMQKYNESEIHFSLMAVTKDRIETLQEQTEELNGLLMSLGDEDSDQRRQIQAEISMQEQELQQEHSKRSRWRVRLSSQI